MVQFRMPIDLLLCVFFGQIIMNFFYKGFVYIIRRSREIENFLVLLINNIKFPFS
ncbi:hypothetical protein NBO_38g0016 [Nosema bombycis CQ1]|uniref:Uncharacterized protein n=1 Tax=Nosema bombycis (strain CQ1 / CVCC 102059) TaxID=578461 RepID=R0MIT5_NOSB1|nr:hypothetical protein NBO_38g0016 [Nosema bombycis CQ1]|eukprot:EOB14105.1 hypothetical protein NBO_38g0016 [Nosema bombycis CQ1]